MQIPHENIPVQKFSWGDTQGMAFTDRDDDSLPTGVHLFHGNRDLRALEAQRDRVIAMASCDNECREERSFEEIRGIIHRAAPVDISSWKRQLRSIIDYSSQSAEWAYTYGRFNRRYFSGGVYSPGRVYKEQEILTVAVDVSASMVMKPGDIEAAFGVIEELLGKYRVHLVCIDENLFIPEKKDARLSAASSRDIPYIYRAGDWKYLKTGSSGTTFFAPLFNEHMRGHRELLLVITDGEIYDLHLLKKYSPTVWVLPQERESALRAPLRARGESEDRAMTEQKESASEKIYRAGLAEGDFDFAGGGHELLRLGIPNYIFLAGRDWPEFDYARGLARLRELRSAEFIHKAGIFWKDFDFSKGLDALRELGEPEYLYRAGRFWKGFDYEAGLDALIALELPRYVYYAGQEWKTCNLKKGFEFLIRSGSAEYIFYAGAHWKEFDYARGFEALLAAGDSEFIYKAGTLWPEFDHARAWHILERDVTGGAQWRGKAFSQPKWRAALREMWREISAF